MDGKKSFIAYSDWKLVFDELPDEDAGKLIKHIFAYVNNENPTSDSVLIKAVFANIKQTLKRDLVKWEAQQSQRVTAGKASAEVRRNKLTIVERALNERTRKPTVSVNVSVNAKEVLSYLNLKRGSSYQVIETTLKPITARLKEGATVEQCKAVIDYKIIKWGQDDKMKDYLKPDTLFAKKHWANYVQEVILNSNGSMPEPTKSKFYDEV